MLTLTIPRPHVRWNSLENLLVVLVFFIFLLAGCTGKNGMHGKNSVLSAPNLLYKEAMLDLKAGYYGQAAKKFQSIEEHHPYSEWARKALIRGAFANYRQSKYESAIDMAQRYITFYPTTEETSHAYYIIGLSYFRQIPGIDRDQEASHRTISTMQELIDRFPKSRYLADAKKKIRRAREKLAGKEMQIGRYYLQRRQYLAAISHFRSVIEEYSETQQIAEALYRLVESNYAMGLVPEAWAVAFTLGKKYPTSFWNKEALTLLQKDRLKPKL